jgi:hypothetical protein
MTWLRLSEATALIHHDTQKGRERLERAISKAWLQPLGGPPQPTLDPNVPLRIHVTPAPGMRTESRVWLDNPVLDWETSEIECLCWPWTLSRVPSAEPATQCQAGIEVWSEDLARLWGGASAANYGPGLGS